MRISFHPGCRSFRTVVRLYRNLFSYLSILDIDHGRGGSKVVRCAHEFRTPTLRHPAIKTVQYGCEYSGNQEFPLWPRCVLSAEFFLRARTPARGLTRWLAADYWLVDTGAASRLLGSDRHCLLPESSLYRHAPCSLLSPVAPRLDQLGGVSMASARMSCVPHALLQRWLDSLPQLRLQCARGCVPID